MNCDAGRVRRPLIIVDNTKPRLTREHVEGVQRGELRLEDLVDRGVIEYLDADEEENALVADAPSRISERTTHLEIAPYTILGICASLIPYPEHNQSPRNAYESAMAKQALGIFAVNYANRVDSRAHILHYPQVPVIRTKPMEIIKYDSRPAGQNCVVALLCYQGYNMEDAIIINKIISRSEASSVHRSTVSTKENADNTSAVYETSSKFQKQESEVTEETDTTACLRKMV